MKTKICFCILFLVGYTGTHAQWNSIDSISNGNFYSVNFMNADTGFAYHEFGTLRRTIDGGATWDSVTTAFSGFIMDIDFANSHVAYSVGGAWFPFGNYKANAIMKTIDGGLTWDSVYGDHTGGVLNSIEVISPQEFYAVGSNVVLHSNNSGASIDTLIISSMTNESYSRIQFVNSTIGYALGSFYLGQSINVTNLYKTIDAGKTWLSVFSDTSSIGVSDFTMTASGDGILVGHKGLVLNTVDGGATWTNTNQADTNLLFMKLERVDNHLYAIVIDASNGSTSIYFSGNWAAGWQNQISFFIPTYSINDLSIPTKEVGYFATSRKVYKNEQLISLAEATPMHVNLYPNPTSEKVYVEVLEQGEVEITLFNSIGKIVKVSKFESIENGELDVSFLPAGIYMLEIKNGNNSVIKKLIKE